MIDELMLEPKGLFFQFQFQISKAILVDVISV